MTFRSGLPLLAVAASLLEPTAAFWRLPCKAQSAVARIDPIVDRGNVSAHLHNIFGGKNLDFDSDYDRLMSSQCTSCQVEEDKSAYWTPSLMLEHEDGQFEPVQSEGGMLVYYLLNGDETKPFPKGFELLAGDPTLRDFPWKTDPDPYSISGDDLSQLALSQKAIGYNCLKDNYADAEPTLNRHFLPEKSFIDQNCPFGLRVEVMFPSCWNGKDVTAPDHKSHMAYPDGVMDGKCPEGFPVRLPRLLYEVFYNTHQYRDTPGRYLLANGDTTGYGMHGDFLAAWDNNVLEAAIRDCTDDSGEIERCQHFTLELNDDVASKCKVDLPEVCKQEQCDKKRKGLCGDNRISDNAADKVEDVQDEAEDAGQDMDEVDEKIDDHLEEFDQATENDEYVENEIVNVAEEPVAYGEDDDGSGEEEDDANANEQPKATITSFIAPENNAEGDEDAGVRTITKTEGGTVIVMVVKEVYVTVTEEVAAQQTQEAEAQAYAKRHLHHHQQRHQHKH